MKKIFLLALLSTLFSCYQAERNCKDFKTGKFKFEHEVDGKMQTTYFIRTDSLEIETYNGKTDTATVRWVNDCEYVLQKLHPKTMKEREGISMKILTTSGNSYTFEFGIVGSDVRQRGTVTKLD